MDFFQYDFLTKAFLATVLLSLCCGVLSPLVIARRFAFLGSAVSHSTLLGLSLANLFLAPENSSGIFLVTLAITLFLAFILSLFGQVKNLPTDSAIGIFLTSTMGLGMIILSKTDSGNTQLVNFLFGNIYLTSNQDLLFILFLTLIMALAIFIPFRHWAYITSDEKGAMNAGIKVSLFHTFFVFLLTVVIVTGLKVAGSLAINSWLIAPGIFGAQMARKLKNTFLISILFSLTVSLLGLFLSNFFDWPPGATFCLVHLLGLTPLFFTKN